MKRIVTHNGKAIADDPLWTRVWAVVNEVNEWSGDALSQYECIRKFVDTVIAEAGSAATTRGGGT